MADGPIELLSRARAGETEALGRAVLPVSELPEDDRPDRSGTSTARAAGTFGRCSGGPGRGCPSVPSVHRARTKPRWWGGCGGWWARSLPTSAGITAVPSGPGTGSILPLDAPYEARRAARPGEGGGRLLDMLALSQTSPSEIASRRELVVLLADALHALPDSEADVLWLYHAENLSFEAIGDRMGLSRKSVRGIWARGLKRLKRSLEGPPGGSLRYDDASSRMTTKRRPPPATVTIALARRSRRTLRSSSRAPRRNPKSFAARYPDLSEDILSALQGLELVHGLVGQSSGSFGPGSPGRNIESGRRIAGYRVVRELGRGGMGTVYEAVHVSLDRPVALKVLGTHAAPDSSARRRFLNEARTAAGTASHPHRAGLRRRSGRRTVLLRHAADRRERARSGGAIPPSHSPVPALGIERLMARDRRPPMAREPNSNSLGGSRFSRLWIRVSENLPWHAVHGTSRSTANRRGRTRPGARPARSRERGAEHPFPFRAIRSAKQQSRPARCRIRRDGLCDRS